jgi:hypothetical protein
VLCVYDGQRCIGFIIARGKTGFEGDIDDKSIGVYPTQREAAAALRAFCDEGER